jgi:hypothetical protein
MHAYAFDTNRSRCDHGYRRGTTPSDPPEVRRRAVIQCRTFSGSEHRGEHAGLARESGMTYRVYAQMDAVKLAACSATARGGRADPGGTEVLSSHEPVLSTRNFGETQVGWCRSVAGGAIV